MNIASPPELFRRRPEPTPHLAVVPPARPIVQFEHVEKTYAARQGEGAHVALQDINFAVPEGCIVGVIGRSGAGKSTLIRLVNGLERATAGRILVDAVDVTRLSEKGLRRERRSIGMIFQHFNLLARRTAFDNVALPLEIAGLPAAEIRKRVEPLLDLVGLSDKRGRYPAELSGGQKQRVGIARALATNPRVLLSDEATSALDPETTGQILDLLRRLNAELNLTVLLITHEMSVIKSVADRVAVLEAGRIVEEGPVHDIFARPTHATTKNFVSAVTGAKLSPHLERLLSPVRLPGGKRLIRVVLTGPYASEPVIAQLSRQLSINIGIVQAQIDAIAGRPFGVVVLSVPEGTGRDGGDNVSGVLEAFGRLGLEAEVLGHVV